MAPLDNPALPRGSKVLVTGADGLVGSHVSDQLLAHGYSVRGAVLDPVAASWLAEHFATKYGDSKFEFAPMRDFTKGDLAGAFDDAVKGVAGIAHVATVLSMNFSGDPNHVITPTVNALHSILESASKEPSVKRFVMTSSTATIPNVDMNDPGIEITADSWNTTYVEQAWTPPFTPEKGLIVYEASKVEAEQAFWRYVKKNKPHFAANTVIPSGVFGHRVSHEHQGNPTSTSLPLPFFYGQQKGIEWFNKNLESIFYINTADIGRLHLLSLVHPEVASERVFGCAAPVNGNVLLATFRTLFPERSFPEDAPGLPLCRYRIAGRERAEALLRDLGRPGFVSLEESLRGVVEGHL